MDNGLDKIKERSHNVLKSRESLAECAALVLLDILQESGGCCTRDTKREDAGVEKIMAALLDEGWV